MDMKSKNMNNKYFATAKPMVTDDDGLFGYLWKGVVYDKDSKYYTASFQTNSLFYSPEEAINEVTKLYERFQEALEGKVLNLDDPNDFQIWMDAKEEWLNKAFREASKDIKPIY